MNPNAAWRHAWTGWNVASNTAAPRKHPPVNQPQHLLLRLRPKKVDYQAPLRPAPHWHVNELTPTKQRNTVHQNSPHAQHNR